MRQQDVLFDVTSYPKEVRTALKKSSGITSIAPWNGNNVVATSGTTSVQLLRKNERATGSSFHKVFRKGHADGFPPRGSSRAKAFAVRPQMTDGPMLAGKMGRAFAKTRSLSDLAAVGEVLAVESVAIMGRKGDFKFMAAIEASLAATMKSADMGKRDDVWFVRPIPLSNTQVGLPASDASQAPGQQGATSQLRAT